MHTRSLTKILALTGVVMYILLASGAVLAHCHGIEDYAGHEDHCQTCHWTHFSTADSGKAQVNETDTNAVSDVPLGQTHKYAHPSVSILHTRAPPVSHA